MEQHHTGIIALLDEACFLVGTVTDRVREREGRRKERRGEGVGEGEERVKKEEGGRKREGE